MSITQQKKPTLKEWVISSEFEPVIERIVEYGSNITDDTEETIYKFVENGFMPAPFDYNEHSIDFMANAIFVNYGTILYKKLTESRRLNKLKTDF